MTTDDAKELDEDYTDQSDVAAYGCFFWVVSIMLAFLFLIFMTLTK